MVITFFGIILRNFLRIVSDEGETFYYLLMEAKNRNGIIQLTFCFVYPTNFSFVCDSVWTNLWVALNNVEMF